MAMFLERVLRSSLRAASCFLGLAAFLVAQSASASLTGNLVTVSCQSQVQSADCSFANPTAIVEEGTEFTGILNQSGFTVEITVDFSSDSVVLAAEKLSGVGLISTSVHLVLDVEWQPSPGSITALTDLGGDALVSNASFTDDEVTLDLSFAVSDANPTRSATLEVSTTHQGPGSLIFESATLGASSFDGNPVSVTQFLGVRFLVSSPVTTGAIGGHFASQIEGDVFGAIVALSDSTDLPDTFGLTSPDVLGATLMGLPPVGTASGDVSAPLSVTLVPGWYGLVFGSGLFGASGKATAANTNFEIVPISFARVGSGWVNANFSNLRFFITSDAGGPPDADGDGVPDDEDVCHGGDDTVDSDLDGVPDFCDPCPSDDQNDADGDGVCGDIDICPGGDDTVNTDGDSLPDFCDVCPIDPENDADGDGLCESDDNCPNVANSNQNDLDEDGIGDVCDDDLDGDSVLNGDDNCLFDPNASQTDFDGDGAGDVCDTDVDGDGVIDADDACVPTPVGDVPNADGCAIAELCPCEHPTGGDKWKNHGAYVSCVAHASEDFVAAGLITEAEKDAIVSDAGMSTCGHKLK